MTSGDSDNEPDTLSETDWEERRQYPRLRETCRVRIKPIAGASVPEGVFDTDTIDISGGGLAFSSETEFKVDDCVAIELTFPDLDDPLTALARVAYCRPDDAGFAIGAQFLWVGWGIAGAQEAISEHVEKALENGDA